MEDIVFMVSGIMAAISVGCIAATLIGLVIKDLNDTLGLIQPGDKEMKIEVFKKVELTS